MYTLSGITVAGGIAEGRALLLHQNPNFCTLPSGNEMNSEAEAEKFKRASTDFSERLMHVISGPAPDQVRDLFGAAAGYINNPDNQDAVMRMIRSGCTAAMACRCVLLENLKNFKLHDPDQELNDHYKELASLIREFAASIEPGSQGFSVPVLSQPTVIIAKDLTPARFLCLRTDLVRAVILENGAASENLGIILRDLRLPSLFSVSGASSIRDGEYVLVDAGSGNIIVDPPREAAAKMLSTPAAPDQEEDFDDDQSLIVNINPSVGATRELDAHAQYRHYGLGLLRSEFLFLGCKQEPSEELMRDTFAMLFSKIPNHAPITARTFDFAGDKKPLFALECDSAGPLRGYGAMTSTSILQKELRALLQAAPQRRITIVFPLIVRISEAGYLKQLAEQCAAQLDEEGKARSEYDTALMIETPAAVLSAPAFAQSASMFIIGTSSLAEYASAPRRPDNLFTPALAKMIAMACKAAHDHKVPIGIVGRFSSRVELLPFFLKMGVSYITVDSYFIPKLRSAAARLDLACPCFSQALYDRVMAISSGREIAALINDLDLED